eukprot:TRINITY_DN9820_c0_g1_i1.p1 TRINITY_DN9820_c0_g1~~TRINITY_DN9820_c0_g1_i1.p1  ORF type:complete len:1155 (+),score=292.98 TRINITY_DN9820_c0_g1_i1:58-3465(+)
MMRNKVDKKSEHVRVFVRARPLQEGEARAPIQLDTMRKEVLAKTKTSRGQTSYTFNKVFDTETEQCELFDTACKPLVSEMLKGFSCTIFAYGQTNSGKTHSMMGDLNSERMQGLTPRACKHIFNELMKNNSQFTVRLSCVELYKEEFYDMLVNSDQPKQKLKLFQDGQKGVVMKGVEEVVVSSPRDVIQNLEGAIARRQTAATGMNNRSSRSHFIATISVTIKEETMNGEQLFKMGKLHLVDLAGSESAKRTDSVGTERQSEAAAINKSLLTLGRVISSLSNPSLHSHTPYRESALTRLLQDALGGRCKTSIITTISLARSNLDETLSTLEYASSARKIENDPEMNRTLSGNQLVSDYETELMRLRSELVDQRNGTGVFISEERYAMMQARLKELEEDHVLKDEKLLQLQDNLQECAIDIARCSERNNHKNILLEHHQDVENSLIDAIDESQLREDGLRAAIKKRDHTEQKNVNVISEASEALLSSCSDARDALRSATDSVSVVTTSVRDVTQKVSTALCDKNRKVSDLLDKQGQLGQHFYQGINDLVATNTQHTTQILGQVIDLSTSSAQEASAQTTTLANTVSQVTSNATKEHENSLKSGLADLFSQFLAASQESSSTHRVASNEAVEKALGSLQKAILTSVKDLSVGITSDLNQNCTTTKSKCNTLSEEVSSACNTVSDQIQGATEETVSRADASHQKLNADADAIAGSSKVSIQQIMEEHNTKMMCLQSRTAAAVQSSVDEKQKLQSELQALIAEYDAKSAQITTTLNDTLNTIENDRQAETRDFYTKLSAAQDTQNQSVKEVVSNTSASLSSTFQDLTQKTATIKSGVASISQLTANNAQEVSDKLKQESESMSQYIDTCQQSMLHQSKNVMEIGYGTASELFESHAQSVSSMNNKVQSAVDDLVSSRIQNLTTSMSQMSATANHTAAEISSCLSAKSDEIKSGKSHFSNAQQTLSEGLQSSGRTFLGEVSEAAVEGKGVLSNATDIMNQYVTNMNDGMASGTGEIMSGINATEAILNRLRENTQYMTEGVRQHRRGGTPSPQQVYIENTHDYNAVIGSCTDDQIMEACETPSANPRAVGQFIENHPPLYRPPAVTPVKQSQHFDPQVYTPGPKTPKTPLGLRSGNIMCD